MTLSVANLTFDCADPQRVAAFWSAAMSLPVDDGGSPYFVSIGVSRPAQSPNWFFAAVPEGRTAKNRLHLDLEADNVAAEVDRLVSLGATLVGTKAEHGHEWSVLEDVEGNVFCVSGPH